MATTPKVKGLASLGRKLKRLKVKPKDVETALRLGGQLIVNQAKINAPFLSGQLRRDLRVWTKVSGSEVEARAGTNLDYARRQEFGFVGADKLGRRYNQAARPYMRPAAKSKRAAALKEIRLHIARSFRRSVSKV